jgi:hypothetical protein
MPFPSAVVKESIVNSARSLGVIGQDIERVGLAIALTCEVQFLLPGTSMVTASGAAGAGMVAGASPPTGVIPLTMATNIYNSMASKGLIGSNNFNMCLGISMGICNMLSSLVLFGVSPGVGSGAGSAKAIQFNPAAFYTLLTTNMASLGMIGQSASLLALAISEGICMTMSATLIVPVAGIAGPVGPSPAVTVFPAQFV